MSNAIQTENLVKNFGRIQALKGLTMAVPAGAIYALVGPNGAGKTTAIKILMNIFRPTRGRAEVLGVESARIAGRAFRSIGYASENQEMPGWMRVDALFAYLRSFYPSWDRQLESELVEQLGLTPDRKLGALSRGMRMKAALASALAYRPKLIILDEPFGGLDPLVRDELIEAVLDRAPEATVFISSHDLAEIEHLASHVGYLEEGRLRFSEETAALTDRFREVELTLDEPALPAHYPETWMQLNRTGGVVRFIESHFESERTNRQIREVFGNARDVTFAPMSLRSIFLAMAKAGRKPV